MYTWEFSAESFECTKAFLCKVIRFRLDIFDYSKSFFFTIWKNTFIPFIVFKYVVLPSLKWKKSILGANIQINQNIKIKIFSAKGVIPFICWTFKLILSKGVISFICWTFKLILSKGVIPFICWAFKLILISNRF